MFGLVSAKRYKQLEKSLVEVKAKLEVVTKNSESLKESMLKSMKEQEDVIRELKEPLEFDYSPSKKVLIVRLGDPAKGWIPGEAHAANIRKQIKATSLDKKYNIILFNYAIHTEFVEP